MAAVLWTAPGWTAQVPRGVSFDEEVALLKGFVREGEALGFRVVPERDLDFDARGYADLVLEREDGARLMFALSEKAPNALARLDVSARPDPRHIELRRMADGWRIVTDSRTLDPRPLETLGLAGLAEMMLTPGL